MKIYAPTFERFLEQYLSVLGRKYRGQEGINIEQRTRGYRFLDIRFNLIDYCTSDSDGIEKLKILVG